LYETALKECGYTGNAIYWDWTRVRLAILHARLNPDINQCTLQDAGPNVVNSPLFDPVTGFGGTGTNVNERSPIATGPFVNFVSSKKP
jgi:hypothetical protein